MAACAAQGQRRIAAAVEEQHGLFAAGEGCRQGLAQSRRQPLPRLRAFAAHVNGRNMGHDGAAVAVGKMDSIITPLLHVDGGFQGRRGRGQHHRARRLAPPHHGHVAGVIDNAFFLFIGGFMFLVDDDEAEIGKGQEQSGPRPHYHMRAVVNHRPPGRPPLPLR